MSVHDVVVFTGDIGVPSSDPDERHPTVHASVAVCRDCPWRGEIRGSPVAAAEDKRDHQRATGMMG
jgi:CxxC motif-containing protein (DUF1111 family)